MVFFTKKDIWLLTNRIDFLVAHFIPAKVAHFDPAKVVHFHPARVVYYDRFLQFKPDSTAIDLFYTENVLVNTNKILLDYDEWTIVDFSSQHGGNENSVQNVIDGNQNTRWHSLAGGSIYPHWVIIDLGGLVDFSTLEVLRSTFDGGGDDRATDKFTFEVSTDNDVWVDAGVFDFNRFTNDPQSYHISLSEPVRYVRFTAIEGPEDNFVLGAIKLYK